MKKANCTIKTLLIGYYLTLIFCSCNSFSNNYYYVVDGGEEELIKARSDSEAYLEAYRKFQISKKVHEDMVEKWPNTLTSAPVSFQLLDKNKVDITYAVQFSSMAIKENKIKESIESRENIFTNIEDNSRSENSHASKYDTAGLYLAPVKVIKASFSKKEYSNYKDITLHYKNISGKKIQGIRFKWYGENAFNEPADMGGLRRGWGSGFDDDVLRPGASTYSTWGILSRDGKKVLIAYPYEVVYTDGEKWELP